MVEMVWSSQNKRTNKIDLSEIIDLKVDLIFSFSLASHPNWIKLKQTLGA